MGHRIVEGIDVNGRRLAMNGEFEDLARMMLTNVTVRTAARPPHAALPCPYCGAGTLAQPGNCWHCPHCGSENA